MADRLRLLVTTSDFVGRGAERELSNLLFRLPRDRFDIHLCLWRNVFEYPSPSDIPVTILEKSRPWHAWRVVRRLADLVSRWRPDVVLSQLNYVSTLTGLALGQATHRPAWVARLAGNPKVEIRFPVLPVTRRSFRRATFVAGCSAGASGSIGDHLGVPASRIRTLPNIVDVAGVVSASRRGESASDPQRPFVFVHAGRLVAQKNQELLLRALAAMKHREAELWMLGTGPKSRQLQRWAHRLGVAERVRWLGFQPELHGVMAGGNAFVLSSRYEGLPNVVIEAMLAGLPVVSTDCPFGPSELIEPGRTGYLVPTGDGAALASAMDQMVEIGPEEARRWGEQARRSMMERFDPDKILPMYVDLLEHAAREGSP